MSSHSIQSKDSTTSVSVRPARADEMDIVRELFLEYSEMLGVDLCFQSFEEELATLPGKYAEPKGVILLGLCDEKVCGVVAMRPVEDGVCEMKRLYVQPACQKSGLGRRLATEIIEAARKTGYRKMVLDTLPRLEAAIRLYQSLGFREARPYYHNPHHALFFELEL